MNIVRFNLEEKSNEIGNVYSNNIINNDKLNSRLKISNKLELSVIQIIKDLKSIVKIEFYTICKMVSNFVYQKDMIIKVVNDVTYEIWNNPQILNSLACIKRMDKWTYKHCLNVTLVSMKIGVALNLSKIELKNLFLGALLHDVGKLFMPVEVLQKPGKLTNEEYKIVKTHSKCGYEFLKEFDDINIEIKDIIVQHHERIDGLGYPNNLKGDNISYLAKIVSVADVYDAMISKRPYKKALSQKEVIEYLILNKNILFDSKIVYTLCDIIISDR